VRQIGSGSVVPELLGGNDNQYQVFPSESPETTCEVEVKSIDDE